MKRITLALCILTLADYAPVHAQSYYRYTHNEHPVEVKRIPITGDKHRLIDDEKDLVKKYGKFGLTLKRSIEEFHFDRNCHDYAWAPYMSCMCNPTPPGDQTGCWVMGDPSQNWRDASVRGDLVRSVKTQTIYYKEYVFNTSDLQGLHDNYYDEFGAPQDPHEFGIPFPACVVFADNTTGHSGVAMRFVPIPLDETHSYVIYSTKYGNLGIFEHRWGPPYLGIPYNEDLPLSIFVPNGNDWGWFGDAPPYAVYGPFPFD
jgi:hypothetical protein